MRHRLVTALGWMGAAVGLALGCSAGGEENVFAPGKAGASGAGGMPGQGGSGGLLVIDASDNDSSLPSFGCSADLQNVVDGNGTVVEKCAPAKGCAGGKCVLPCEAAAASRGNVGCEFSVPTPSFMPQIKQPCFAVFVANNWPGPIQISVTRGGQSYPVTTFGRIPNSSPNPTNWPTVPDSGLPQDQVAVLFMSADPASYNMNALTCPVAPAMKSATAVGGTGRGRAWHITTDAPVSAYDIHPYGGAKSFLPSAQMLLPTSAWGTNYVAVVPKLGDMLNPPNGPGPQYGIIVASEDNTTVEVLSTANLPGGGGVEPAPANATKTYTLQRDEFLQWEPTGEMTGTVISADRPISFTGGNGYLCLKGNTSAGGGCDSGHQAIPPVSALGYRYVGIPYATRRANLQPESVLYRIVGAVDGTTLSYDPPVAGAPPTLGVGQMADFQAVGPFVVQSQDAEHPFYLGQMMTGCKVTGGSRPGISADAIFKEENCLGDEEYVNILPPAQFLSKYVFFTDPTYGTTNLVLTRVKTDGVFKDVTVGCLGPVGGWQPVGSSGDFEITDVDLMRAKQGQGSCTNGQHTAWSDGPFGVTVWGLDSFSSYAYPAGGNVAPINTVVVPPIPK
jgi:hypothetical protein